MRAFQSTETIKFMLIDFAVHPVGIGTHSLGEAVIMEYVETAMQTGGA